MLDFTLGLLPSGFNWATAGPLASAAALSASASSGTSLSNSENGADVVDVGSSNAVVVVVVDVAGDLDLGVGPNGGLVDLPNLFCCLLPLFHLQLLDVLKLLLQKLNLLILLFKQKLHRCRSLLCLKALLGKPIGVSSDSCKFILHN